MFWKTFAIVIEMPGKTVFIKLQHKTKEENTNESEEITVWNVLPKCAGEKLSSDEEIVKKIKELKSTMQSVKADLIYQKI